MARATWILVAVLILSGCRGRFSRSAVSRSTEPEPASTVSRTETPAPPAPDSGPQVQKVRAAPMRFLRPIDGRLAPLPDHRRPRGVQFEAPIGAPVRAAAAGEIALVVADYPSIGPAVFLSHDGGFTTFYGPIRLRPDLKEGERVAAGQPLGQLVSARENDPVPCLRFRLLRRDVDVTDVTGYLVPEAVVPGL